MWRRRSSVLLMLLLLLSVSIWAVISQVSMRPSKVFAHGNGELSAWTSSPPIVDGFIDPFEWASAANATYMTTGGLGGVFYVMNDAVNLYLAVVTADPTLSLGGVGADAVMLYFDSDHDGDGPEPGDEILGWEGYLGEGFRDGFSDGSYVWRKDADFGGTSEGAAAATNNGTHNHFEIVHPLITVDAAHDFSLRMSSSPTIGFGLRLTVDGFDKGWWPSLDPASWLDIAVLAPTMSAWASTTPVIDGLLRPAVDFLGLPAEWQNASKIEFMLSWGAELHEAAVYVLNDYINLYLAFEIHGEDLSANDQVVFNFDNNNDGLKETQDDRLSVDGFNLFHDGFFAGLPYSDVAWEGTLDGVGAVQFAEQPSTINGSYGFEIAHPLNTSDDGFDFSLSVGDTVGFNVLFFDGGGVVGDGWPTFTQEDWNQMADIVIASPPELPPAPNMNLSIRKIEITQGIQWLDHTEHDDNSVPLARGKSTIVRVFVEALTLAVGIRSVNVFLYATDGASGVSLVQPHVLGSIGPLDTSFFARRDVERKYEYHTANFFLPPYWVDRGTLTLTAFVKAPDSQVEHDYTDNWMSTQTFSLAPTKSWKIGYYLINYRPTAIDESPNIPSPLKEAVAYRFFEKVTPMPDLSDAVEYSCLGTIRWEGPSFMNPDGSFNASNQAELLEDLAILWGEKRMRGEFYDQICGLFTNAGTVSGQAADGRWDGAPVFVAHEDRPWSFAHEINHNVDTDNPDHSWLDPDNPWIDLDTKNSSQTYGFDTWGSWLPGEAGDSCDIVKVPAVVVGGGEYGALMSYYDDYRWISPWEWGKLVDAFDPPAEGVVGSRLDGSSTSSPGLWVSGVVSADNSGSLEPVFETLASLNITSPGGSYTVELRGAPPQEPLLYSRSFDVSFESEAEYDTSPVNKAHFALNLPFVTGTHSISLWNASVLLDKITASSSPPSVTLTYPNGGEVVGSSFDVSWTASDFDEDPLTFRLFYTTDDGAIWRPLSPRIQGTSYRVDASELAGSSQWRIRVQASDGFYSSEDESDAVFSVPSKGPRNPVATTQHNSYSNEPVGDPDGSDRRVPFGSFVILKGSAFDPEDGVLGDTALTWTSDLNGTLGAGRILAVTGLLPGVHNITLTATDSHGNNATTTITITVAFRDVAVTDVAAAKRTVGQGYSIRFTVAVENQGNVPETFNVSLYADTDFVLLEETVSEVLAGSTAVVTLTWSTSGFAKGNYSLRVIAETVPGERDISDNTLDDGWIFVTIPGDVDSDKDVDIFDIVRMASGYGTKPPDFKYDPNCDIDSDGDIDIFDVVIAAGHYGQSW